MMKGLSTFVFNKQVILIRLFILNKLDIYLTTNFQIMNEKLKSLSDEELKKSVQVHFIKFFVFLAIATGLILTSIALGAFGDQPLLVQLIPIGIAIIFIFPIYSVLKLALAEKKELDQR